MDNHTPSLKRLATRASSRPSLMSGLLALYREQESMDDEHLAAFLECKVDALPRLALCRRPRPAPGFRDDVEAIATHVGANGLKVATLIRSAEAAEAMREAPAQASTASMLLAARDRIQAEPEQGEEAEDDLQHCGDAEPEPEDRPRPNEGC